MPFAELLEELIELLGEDAEALGSVVEIENTRAIITGGTSATRQRRVFQQVFDKTQDQDTALRAVVSHLIEEYHADL